MNSLTGCCRDTLLHVGGMTGSVARAAIALLFIKSTTLNHFHGAAFILWTYDCIITVLSGVKLQYAKCCFSEHVRSRHTFMLRKTMQETGIIYLEDLLE